MPVAHNARCCDSAQVQLAVVWDKKFVKLGRWDRKALSTVPGHVLDHDKSAVHNENHVDQAVGDDRSLVLLDDSWQDTETRWRRGVRDQHVIDTLLPNLVWCIDCRLYVRAVEVDECTRWLICERAWEAKNIPEQRACRSDLVYVPTWIDQLRSVDDIVPERAALHGVVNIWRRWKQSGWWESQSTVQELGVSACQRCIVEVVHECLVQTEERVPVVHERSGGNCDRQ